MRTIDPQDLSSRLTNGQNVQLIDVREFPEFANGHIDRARCIPLSALVAESGSLNPDAFTVVVCRSGRRSAQAVERLRDLGFTDVCDVGGGIESWNAAGLPLTHAARAPWSLERQVRLVAGALVLIGVILSRVASPHFVWLSAFIGAGLCFAAITDTCGMAMLLARLPWNRRSAARSCSTRISP